MMRSLVKYWSWVPVLMVACSGRLVLDKSDDSSGGRDGGGEPDASVMDEGGGHPMGGTGGMSRGSSGGSGGRSMVGGGGMPTAQEGGAGGSRIGPPITGGVGGTLIACPGHSLSELSAGGFFGTGGTGGQAGTPAEFDGGTRWPGNGKDCPSAVPTAFAECTAPADQICIYNVDNPQFNAWNFGWYRCLPKDAQSSVWYRVDLADSPTVCPDAQPKDGAQCDSSTDAGVPPFCIYPTANCTCQGSSPDYVWQCYESWAPQRPPIDAPNGGRRIRDLTDEERRQWCEWYACYNSHFASVEPLPPGQTADSMSCSTSGEVVSNGIVPRSPSLPICEANLSLSSCTATLSDLTDCAGSILFGVVSPNGCGHYLDTPGCSGTIVISNDDYSGSRGGAAGSAPGAPPTPGPALNCPLRVR